MPTPAPSATAVPIAVNPVVVWARQQGVASASIAPAATAVTTVVDKAIAKATVS